MESESKGGGAKRSDLSRADRELINKIVSDYLEQAESGTPTENMDEICARHPSLAGKIRSRVQSLKSLGLWDVHNTAPPTATPERLGDFKILSTLGGGGMGVVYEAEQLSLGRIVALKLLRPEYLYFEVSRERFQREVVAIARLQHPNIIPIYTVGEEQGIPYFAMERVHGKSLGDILQIAIAAPVHKLSGEYFYHLLGGSGTPGPLFAGSWADVNVRIIAQIARALAHAHERGVLHRDLKPSNIMITPDGRVLLLDFGLAFSEGTSRMTQSGTQLGSLPYTPPEHFTNKPTATVRGDIYSLGITLYEALTRQLPYSEESAETTIRQILRGEPPAPRRLNRSIAQDVAVVCLKAMDASPSRRYATAADLADDLDNIIFGRPIAAKAPTPIYKIQRWVVRRPARAAAAFLAILLFVGGPLTYAFIQLTHAKEVEKLLTNEKDARGRAERNFSLAVEGVERMLTRVGERDLAEVPMMDRIRRRLLEDALEFTERFVKEKSDDPAVRANRALALVRAADIRMRLGALAESEAAAREAIVEFEKLIHEKQDAAINTYNLLRAKRVLGHLFSNQVRSAEAIDIFNNILSQAKEIEKLDPPPVPRARIAADRLRDGVDLATAQHLSQLEKDAAATIQMILKDTDAAILDADPTAKSGVYLLLSQVERGEGNYNKSESAARQAIASIEAARDSNESEHSLKLRLATCYNSLFRAVGESGRAREGIEYLEKATNIYDELSRDFPWTPAFRQFSAQSRFNQASRLAELRQFDEANDLFLKAEAVMAELARAHPETVDYTVDLARFEGHHAECYHVAGRTEDAIRLTAESIIKLTKALERFPKSNSIIRAVAEAYLAQAAVFLETEQMPPAEAAYRRAIEYLIKARDMAPDTLEAELNLADGYTNLANVLMQRESFSAARESLQKAAESAGRAAGGRELGARLLILNVRIRVDLAIIEFEQDAREKSLTLLLEAIPFQRRGIKAAKPDTLEFARAQELSVFIVRQLIELEELDTCENYIHEVGQLYDDKIEAHFHTAILFSYGSKLMDPSPHKKHFEDEAMKQLELLLTVNFKDVQLLETSPSLSPLRDRQDFKNLLLKIPR